MTPAAAPTFSIVTICLNEAETLRATCDSIVLQPAELFEWIVIDGGSTDGTLDILATYRDHMDTLVSEPDAGSYNAMNKGVARARGEYLVFMNGGDRFVDGGALRSAASALTADVVVGDVMLGDGGDTMRYPDRLPPGFLLKRMLPHQASFIRRKTFLHCGGYDESYRIAGDFELFVRLFQNCNASYGHVPAVIAVFASGGISQSPAHRARRKRENHCIRWRYFPTYRFSMKAMREQLRMLRDRSPCPPPALPKPAK